MNPTYIGAALSALGLVGNLVWTVVNLRTHALITAKIDELKKDLKAEYVSCSVFEGHQGVCSERHREMCRRLDILEGQRGPAPVTPIDHGHGRA